MKHIIKKYSKILTGLAIFLGGITTIYVVAQLSTTEFRLDDQLNTVFGSGVFVNQENIDFSYGGNKRSGLFLLRSVETLSTPEVVVLNGAETGLCYGKVRGLYYNNQRGERIRPIDQDTLSGLQSLHNSYNDMQLSGGLFTNCTGIVGTTKNVFGQVSIIYQNTDYYLMGGTSYIFTNNTHGTYLAASLELSNNALSGYIWDNYGGIGIISANIVSLPVNNTCATAEILLACSLGTNQCPLECRTNNGIVSPIDLTGNTTISGAVSFSGIVSTGITFTTTGILNIINTGTADNTLSIPMSGFTIYTASGTWDGTLLPPSNLTVGDTHEAQFSDAGIPAATEGQTTRKILTTVQAGSTTDSLIASGGFFTISFTVSGVNSGNVLKIYRSENGSTWIENIPQNTCTVNANSVCSFQSNQLSYFAPIKETITTTTSITNTGITNRDGGASRLVKDNCKWDSNAKYNLSGANGNGIDYSPSYYDRTCEGPKSTIPINVPSPVSCSAFSTELNGAYIFARGFDITTINNCALANMNGRLLRKDLAKMMVNFAEKAFNKTGIVIDNSKCAQFADLGNESTETKGYIEKICEYGLMGLDTDGVTPQATFNPYGEITRAQFGTILSRFIWGNTYNNNSKSLYYTTHLQMLKKANIMTKISTPKSKETRGYVMLMMKRIYDKVK